MDEIDNTKILGIEKVHADKNLKVSKKNLRSKIKNTLKKIPAKKSHLDLILAFLTVPVLVTAIIINIGNLQNKNKNIAPTPIPQQTIQPTQEKQIISRPTASPTPVNSTITQPVCKQDVGPISISYPQEGQTVSDNPVCIIIKYSDNSFCSVVWSYKINNGNWSEYTSNSPCLYNVPNGNIKFDLRVQSTVSQNQTALTRNFTSLNNNVVATPTLTPTSTPATSSAALQ